MSLNTTCGENVNKIRQYLGELGPKTSQKRAILWMLESVQKNLKIYNLTTKNAILIKLIMITYLYETFHLSKS